MGYWGSDLLRKQLEVRSHSHLRVKDTRIWFHNTNSLVEGLQRIRCTCFIHNHSRQIKLHILRLQVRREAIADAVLLPARNLDIVSRSCEIANDRRALTTEVRCPEIAANEDEGDGFGLLVADREKCLGRVAVYELDAENLGGGE